jgi:hypothetical protein
MNEWFTQMESNDTSRLSKKDVALKWNVPYSTFKRRTYLASSLQSSPEALSSTMPTATQQSLFASSPAAMPTAFPSSSTTLVSSSKEFASAAGATSAAEGNATSTASFSLASVDEHDHGVKKEPADFSDLNIADFDASLSFEDASASGATAAMTGNATSTASLSLASVDDHVHGVKKEPVDFDELNIPDLDESLGVEDEGDADSSAECCCRRKDAWVQVNYPMRRKDARVNYPTRWKDARVNYPTRLKDERVNYLIKISNISPPFSYVRNTYPNEKKEGGAFGTN